MSIVYSFKYSITPPFQRAITPMVELYPPHLRISRSPEFSSSTSPTFEDLGHHLLQDHHHLHHPLLALLLLLLLVALEVRVQVPGVAVPSCPDAAFDAQHVEVTDSLSDQEDILQAAISAS